MKNNPLVHEGQNFAAEFCRHFCNCKASGSNLFSDTLWATNLWGFRSAVSAEHEHRGYSEVQNKRRSPKYEHAISILRSGKYPLWLSYLIESTCVRDSV